MPPEHTAAPYGDNGETRATSRTREFDRDASILLVGLRGTGKSSLGVIASSAISYHLVDADQVFCKTTGMSRAAYTATYSFKQYRERELGLMRNILRENPYRSLIVCGPGSVEGNGQELLRQFQKQHPVIHVMRDAEEIDQYLRTKDRDRISALVERLTPILRSLSNFEFYNLSEGPFTDVEHSNATPAEDSQFHPGLILKEMEHAFLRLIHRIRNERLVPRPHEARHALSYLPIETRPFTYSLSIPLFKVSDIAQELRKTDMIVDAVELTIDMKTIMAAGKGAFNDSLATFVSRQYYAIRRSSVKTPIIFHVELPTTATDDASSLPDTAIIQDTYFQLLLHALRLAPEYLTVDLAWRDSRAASHLTAYRGYTRIIGHYVSLGSRGDVWNPGDDCTDALLRATKLGADLIRICHPATTPRDNTALRDFVHSVESSGIISVPLIAYNTGRVGRSSCFINQVLTSVTHPLVRPNDDDDDNLASRCQLTVQECQRALYASFVLEKMVFGIFGNDVSSAMSPAMHNAAFRFSGMPHEYRIFQSTSIQGLGPIIRCPNFGGASITSPFKKEVMSMVDYLSPDAQAIGTVNTIIPLRTRRLDSLLDRNHGGPIASLYGDNTDWIGIQTCIRQHLSPVNAVKARTTGLVIGAGDMAYAAVYSLIRLGVRNIFIQSQRPDLAEALCARFHKKTFALYNLNVMKSSPGNSPERTEPRDTLSQQTIGPSNVAVAQPLDEPWRADADPPAIVVSCVPGYGSRETPAPPYPTLHSSWLANPTGGVMVEVCTTCCSSAILQ